jgi:hypothetical protein
MADILPAFNLLNPSPRDGTSTISYFASRIESSSRNYIAKSELGQPVLLIETCLPVGAYPASLKLENLTVLHGYAGTMKTPEGEPGLNYLCAGYKKFFRHIDPAMQRMTLLLRNQRAPAEVMAWVNSTTPQTIKNPNTPRSAPCPCGSGKKYKFCCGTSPH